MSPPDRPADSVALVHADVERQTRRLHVLHAARLQCRCGCSGCCVDGLTVFDVEAERIRRAHPDLLAAAAPGPEGACAFLDGEGRCRIYVDRPYVCRTQGLPLRWLDEAAGEPVELRDICPLNEAGEPIERLPAAACWTLGPIEERLGRLQVAAGPGARRTRLRDLFAHASDGHAFEVGTSSSLLEPRKAIPMGDKSPKAKDKSKKQHTADKNQKQAVAADKAKPAASGGAKKGK